MKVVVISIFVLKCLYVKKIFCGILIEGIFFVIIGKLVFKIDVIMMIIIYVLVFF